MSKYQSEEIDDIFKSVYQDISILKIHNILLVTFKSIHKVLYKKQYAFIPFKNIEPTAFKIYNQQYLNKKRLVSNSKSQSKPKLVNPLPSNPKTSQSKSKERNVKQQIVYQYHIQEVQQRLSYQQIDLQRIHFQDQ
ncbi:hypothetical protein ABPG72_019005 [Tetrahymena utriculariae]